ncbi:MAG: hypothetical protein KIH69_019395 [Anaerolineae bacterium]|nr:hypothetical protein [Anaerolineae bacterium]
MESLQYADQQPTLNDARQSAAGEAIEAITGAAIERILPGGRLVGEILAETMSQGAGNYFSNILYP